MKTNITRILTVTTAAILCACGLLCSSCEKDVADLSNPSQALNVISTEWGSSPADIRNHMKGYVSIKDNDRVLIYSNSSNNNRIAYKFINDKLAASVLLIKNDGESPTFEDYLKKYQYVGSINNNNILQSAYDNTIATISTVEDGEYSSIGFAPLASDIYEKAEPISVVTQDEIRLLPTTVTLHGSITGIETETEAGFMLSLSPEMDELNCRTTSASVSAGDFEATLQGILDQEKYYYRAYAIIDGATYYGEIRSFETEPLKYTINGKEFQVIKVEGGPYGTFSILQTEISVNDKIEIGGIDLGITLDCDKVDGNVSLYEVKKFVGNICRMTGFYWRYPTYSEWIFAAKGGLFSNDYIYSGGDNIDDVAWYIENCSGPQTPGTKEANELGIYDMSGNYAEIVSNKFSKMLETGTYPLPYTLDAISWDSSRTYGGYWGSKAASCKVTFYENTAFKEKNLVDGKKYAFRFIYSHHINSYCEY